MEIRYTLGRGDSGIYVYAIFKRNNCSGERCQASQNRSLKYLAQNSQKEAYHGLLSPARVLGLEDMTQPSITSRRKPFRISLSRWVRVSSFERNRRRPFVCNVRSAVVLKSLLLTTVPSFKYIFPEFE